MGYLYNLLWKYFPSGHKNDRNTAIYKEEVILVDKFDEIAVNLISIKYKCVSLCVRKLYKMENDINMH